MSEAGCHRCMGRHEPLKSHGFHSSMENRIPALASLINRTFLIWKVCFAIFKFHFTACWFALCLGSFFCLFFASSLKSLLLRPVIQDLVNFNFSPGTSNTLIYSVCKIRVIIICAYLAQVIITN